MNNQHLLVYCISQELDIIYYNFIISRLNNSGLEEKEKINLILKYAQADDFLREKKRVFVEVLKEIKNEKEE